MKRTLPLFIAGISGIVLIVTSFIPYTIPWGVKAGIWFDILAGIAFILGGANLMKNHLKKISNGRAGWGYSAVTIVAFVATLAIGMFKLGVGPQPQFPSFAWSGVYNAPGSGFNYMYEYFFKPLTAAMFALLAFYVASAAFRAFRAKNFEAFLLLGTAFIVLLGRVYLGTWLTSWMPESMSEFTLPGLTDTIMQVINKAGNRVIMMGVALGVVSLSLRVILGIDRSYMGSDEG